MLVKLTPGVKFTNTFCTAFSYKSFSRRFLYLHFRFELLLVKEYWCKCSYKLLVKLTIVNTIQLFIYRFVGGKKYFSLQTF